MSPRSSGDLADVFGVFSTFVGLRAPDRPDSLLAMSYRARYNGRGQSL